MMSHVFEHLDIQGVEGNFFSFGSTLHSDLSVVLKVQGT